MNGATEAAELTVVIPMDDPRGWAVDMIKPWLNQTCDPSGYKIVLVSGGSERRAEETVRSLLRAHDRILRVPPRHELGLVHAGAMAADTPWLLITELHAPADPEAVQVSLDFCSEPDGLAGAYLNSRHHNPTRAARLEARLYDLQLPLWSSPDHWNKVRLRGFVISRSAYVDAGGLDETLGLFSEPALAARLNDKGYRLGFLERGFVTHTNCSRVATYLSHVADYTEGECLFKEDIDPRFFERYFGSVSYPQRFWPDERSRAARELGWILADRLRSPRRGGVRLGTSAVRRLLYFAPRLGTKLMELKRNLQAAGAELLPTEQSRWRAYYRAHHTQVRLTRRQWKLSRGTGPMQALHDGRTPIEEVAAESLIGFFPPERTGGRAFRWGQPIASLRLSPSAGNRWLVLDTGGLRGTSCDFVLDVFLDGERIPAASWRREAGVISLPVPGRAERAHRLLTIVSAPLRPDGVLPDPRLLGIPVGAVELSDRPAPPDLEVEERTTPGSRLGKVVHVNTADVGGGTERVASTLLAGFERRGIDSWLVVGAKRTDNPKVVEFHSSPFIDYFPYDRGSRRSFSAAARFLEGKTGRESFYHPFSRRVLEMTGSAPDVLVCHNLHGGYFDLRVLAEISSRFPVVVNLADSWMLTGHCAVPVGCGRWEHGCGSCPDLKIPPAIERDRTASNWRRKRDLYRRTKLYVATPSHWLMDRLERSMLATAVVSARVIPYAVDAETFKGGSQPRAREALSLDAEASVLLFVSSSGSVNPYKDYETVRRAARIVAQARPVVLAVVGRSQEDERDGDLLVRHVGYLDSKDELAEWYRASDLLVHASWEESFGIVVAEALACGLPVVATRVGGVPEVMADGEHGSLVEPGNPEAMAEAVRRLISDPALRERMGEQGAAHVRREFGEAAMTERYIDFCRHAIDDHPLRAARSG